MKDLKRCTSYVGFRVAAANGKFYRFGFGVEGVEQYFE